MVEERAPSKGDWDVRVGWAGEGGGVSLLCRSVVVSYAVFPYNTLYT